MIGVVVGQEDGVHVGQPDRAQQLALRPLGAVEEQPLAAAPDEQSRRRALRRRHRSGRTEKHEVEIHGPILGFAPQGALAAGR